MGAVTVTREVILFQSRTQSAADEQLITNRETV